MSKELRKYKRKAVFCPLKEFDPASKEHSYVELTQWNNGEGFDLNIYNHTERSISIGYGEFALIKKLIKELDK